jgi:hypothetical protein
MNLFLDLCFHSTFFIQTTRGRTATQEGNTVAVLTCTKCAVFVLFASAIQYNTPQHNTMQYNTRQDRRV